MKVLITNSLELVFLASGIFLFSFLATAAIRVLARKYGWMVSPRVDRWHQQLTALHGGVGFYLPFLLGALFILIERVSHAGYDWKQLPLAAPDVILALVMLAGSFGMFILGLWDDLKPVRPVTKLLFQLIGASVFVHAGGIFHLTGISVVDILVTYFWFVGITNAVNMLDNMDGLASGVVIIASVTVLILVGNVESTASSGMLAVPLAIILISSLLGFWFHNRPPATIFMGDSGSLFLGYVLAALTIPSSLNGFMGIRSEESWLSPILVLSIPVLVLAMPIFDTTLVTITRALRAQNVSQGGRDHLSHRLVGLGFPEKKVIWIFYGASGLGSAIAVLIQRFPDQLLPLLGFFGLVLILIGIYLGRIRTQVAKDDQVPPGWTPLISNILYKRHAAEVLLDTVLIILCFYGAYLLRYEGMIAFPTAEAVVRALPLVVAGCLFACAFAGIYRGQWHLISVSDLPYYTFGVVGGSVLSLALVTLSTRFEDGHSRSVYVIFGLLFYIALLGSRLSFRFLDFLFFQGDSNSGEGSRKPVLIYGATRKGKLLYEMTMASAEPKEYAIVGFIDEDSDRVGCRLCGLPIKNGEAWSKRKWQQLPEIWISADVMPNQAVLSSVRLWFKPVIIKWWDSQLRVLDTKQAEAASSEKLVVTAGYQS